MKAYRRLTAAVIIIMLTLTAVLNILFLSRRKTAEGLYLVEAKHAAAEIEKNGSADLSKYPNLIGVYPDDGRLYRSDNHYLIVEAGGRLWRVEYRIADQERDMIAAVNIALGISFICLLAVLIYIRKAVLKPFRQFTSIPGEIAKGNLFIPLPEHKNKWFGKFTWGVEMLRDHLEVSRRHELEAQRDKRLLLLSLSHDITPPLSAIKLSAEALARGLYHDPEKPLETAALISKRASEIENLMGQIRDAANEDLIKFEVHNTEVFLDDIISKIYAPFRARLEPLGTELVIGPHSNCLLICDPDRLAECLQNLVDNAIKYGDGRRVTFSFSDEEDCRLITVTNTGCTLPEDELPHVFESFRRGSNAGTAEGSGLGLYICRKLMNMMDGEAFAQSADDEFSVTLVVHKA